MSYSTYNVVHRSLISTAKVCTVETNHDQATINGLENIIELVIRYKFKLYGEIIIS